VSTCRPLGPREIPRLLTPSSFTDDAGLRPKRRVSALPISHTPILMGGFISGLTYGSLSLQPVDLLAPLVGADRASTQPTGTFTSGLSTVWSPAPPPDITTETTGQFSLAGLFPLERQLASLQPLIEPDRRISRIRLSEKTHTEQIRHVTPSATSEHNLGVARLIVNPPVLRCFLRWSLTEAPSLHPHYPASSVVRASPPPHTA